MATGIEIQAQTTINFPHLHDGGQIISCAEECAQTLRIPLLEIETDAPFSSGEEDIAQQVTGTVPNGFIEIVSLTSCDKGFIGGKPYAEVTLRLVAELPISDEAGKLFDGFVQCVNQKLGEEET
jgi:hypothetical protein